MSENHLGRTAARLALTPSGVEVVRNLADYNEGFLIEKKDAQERGMTILPAARNAQIGPDDVTPTGFNALLKGGRHQVLRVHKVTSRKHRYLPVKLLVYADQSRRELEWAVCIEDDLATEHGLALDRIQAVERSVSVFEHADLLNDALSTAKTRVLIIAPWVKEICG